MTSWTINSAHHSIYNDNRCFLKLNVDLDNQQSARHSEIAYVELENRHSVQHSICNNNKSILTLNVELDNKQSVTHSKLFMSS
jgi:hypothetical protein